MPKMIPAYEFRRRAREAMKPAMSILVVITLIAMLPSLLSSVITTLADSDPRNALVDLYSEEAVNAMMGTDEESLALAEKMLSGVTEFFAAKWPFMALTAAITMLLSPVLTMGFEHALLRTLRREEITYTTGLARLPIFFKAIGLNLMIFLRIFLWLLPGWALSMLGAVLTVYLPTLGTLVMVAAMVVMFVLMLRAMYSYRLATFVMADDPQTGVNAAIRRSKEIMRGRRMELFSLEVSFIGWSILVSFAQTMLLGMLGNVLGLALGMFASFLVQLYMYMASAAFYQEYGVGPVADAAPAEMEELN